MSESYGSKHHRLVALLLLAAGAMLAVGAAQPSAPEKPRRGGLLRRGVPEGSKVLRDLEYARVGKVSLKLDLYVPPHEKGVRLPLVVWIHGGAWRGGDKAGNPGVMLLPHGYASASINYRLSGIAAFPAQIHDCKAAIRWLRANAQKYDLAAERIGVWGGSAGGHLSALLGTSGGAKEIEGKVGEHLDKSSRVQAVCDFFGPTDLQALAKHFAGGKDRSTDSILSGLFGGPMQRHLDKVKMANPISFISKDDPPFLIVHGDQDRLVPVSQSEILHKALKEASVESKLHVVKGGGHGRGIFVPEIRKMVLAFFDTHLKTSGEAAKASKSSP